MIESYSFGSMVINGRQYRADLIIYPDGRIQDSWWRTSGHRLTAADFRELIDAKPEVIVVGSGSAGLMRPEKGLALQLEGLGIELIESRTAKAKDIFNQLVTQKKTGGCFHLTC